MAVNRFFKPAEYVPIVSEVEYPFKEMFTALASKKEIEDAYKQKIQATGTTDGEMLQYMPYNTGEIRRLPQYDEIGALTSQLDRSISDLSNSIVQNGHAPSEYESVLAPIMQQYNQLNAPNGLIGKYKQAKKDLEAGQKIVSSIEGLEDSPWATFGWEYNKKQFENGEIDKLEPGLAKGKVINRNEEMNKILSGILGEGYASAPVTPDGLYIRTQNGQKISVDKVNQLVEAGIENGPLLDDLLKERNYNIIFGGMTEEQANENFQKAYSNLFAYGTAKKVSSIKHASLSKNPYGDYEKNKQDLLNQERGITPSMPNVKMAEKIGLDLFFKMNPLEVASMLSSGKIKDFIKNSPEVKDMYQNGSIYFKDKSLTTDQKKAAINNAVLNGFQISSDFFYNNEEMKRTTRQMLTNEPDRQIYTLKGQKVSGRTSWQNLGFKNYKEFQNAFYPTGIAQLDIYGTGAGSILGTVHTSKYGNVDVLIEPGEKQKQFFGASKYFGDMVQTGSTDKHYYAVGINNGDYDLASGGPVSDFDPSKGFSNKNANQPPFIIEGQTRINDPKGNSRFDAELKIYKRKANNEYERIYDMNMLNLFEAERDQYIKYGYIPQNVQIKNNQDLQIGEDNYGDGSLNLNSGLGSETE